MYVTSTVIDRHDSKFEVDVCPYEGGSDHSVFLRQQIPSVLTWHFTDYTYHTSVDTIYMSSPRELESVGITTLACGLAMSDLCDDSAKAAEVLDAVKEAALKRAAAEKINVKNHQVYVEGGNSNFEAELANELEVQDAWKAWYDEALDSVATLVDEPSAELKAAIEAAKAEIAPAYEANKDYAKELLDPDAGTKAGAKIDEFVKSIDVPEELQDQVDAIVALAKDDIANTTKNTKIAALTTKAIQDIETLMAADASKKAQALADAKIDAQDAVMAYLKENREAVPSELGLSIVLDSVVNIGTAKDQAAVDAALADAKGAIDQIVAASKAEVAGLKVTSKKLKATAKWQEAEGVTGYEVSFKLKSAKKYKVLKKTSALKAVSKKLKKGKKYQFKVRAYTTINGVDVYGPESAVKTIKIKK